MNDLEKEIIKELSDDARKSFRKIADKLGVSPQTIRAKYDEMKRNGTIKLCSITVDFKKIGYKGSAHLLITIKPGGISSEIVESLRTSSDVIIATRAIGEYEIYAVLVFKDYIDLYEKIKNIKGLPGVSNIDLCLAMPGVQYFPPRDNAFDRQKNTQLHMKKAFVK